jgi:hypothetical protein
MATEAVNVPQSPTMSPRRVSGPRAATPTPTTPPVTNLGGEQLVPISEMAVTEVETTSPVTPTVRTLQTRESLR